MLIPRELVVSLSFALFSASASASSLLDVVTVTGQYGTVDPTTGAFDAIGPGTSDPLGGLAPGPNGLLGISFSGNLDSVNPVTGAISVIGATGLGYSALDTAELGGTVYATDFSNNLYTIDTGTGAATLIGDTGIPPAPSNPADDCDEALFGYGGKLYATFDSFDPATSAVVIAPELYEIDPSTGVATPLAPTSLHLNAAVNVNGSVYAFEGQPLTMSSDVVSLDLATGATGFLASVNLDAALIDGAVVATPEPGSSALAAIGITAMLVFRRRSLMHGAGRNI